MVISFQKKVYREFYFTQSDHYFLVNYFFIII